MQTLGLAAAQVIANALDAFFQLITMLVVLVVGALALAHLQPFEARGPQIVQVQMFISHHSRHPLMT